MSKRRIDAADIMELAQHAFLKLQAEGFVVESVETEIDYGKTSKRGAKLPLGATLTVKFVPFT